MDSNLIKTYNLSLIVPTYNREKTLIFSIPTFYKQKHVCEVIFVDDCSIDNTQEIIVNFANKNLNINTVYLKNEYHQGMVISRINGYKKATCEYVLFCDDDVLLEDNYSEICLELISKNHNVGAVTGRLVLQKSEETIMEAVQNFELIKKNKKYFNFSSFCFRIYGHVNEGQIVPFSHSILLTKKAYLLKSGFDPFYTKGTSYREESDFQANLLKLGFNTVISNRTHCVHLNKEKFNTGGTRMNKFSNFYWAIKNNIYFVNKHFVTFRNFYPQEVSKSKFFLLLKLTFAQISMIFIKPLIRKLSLKYFE